MENQEAKTKKKPKWLKILEQQSWQAELIVSGIAIFGTLQLPHLVKQLSEWALVNLSDELLSYGFLFFQYLDLASIILILGFLIHFIMRTVWIGMIGLVSVYPKGIQDSMRYSKSFFKQLKNEFGDIDKFNQKLDNSCSLMLSSTTVLFLTMLVFNFWLLVGVYTWILLKSYFGIEVANIILISVLSLIGLAVFLMALLNDKKIREKEWAQKIHYPVASKFSKILFLFTYSTYSYVTYTIMTNMKPKEHIPFWKMMGVGMAMGFLAFLSTAFSDIRTHLFFPERYHTYHSYPDDFYKNSYQDQPNPHLYQLAPSIQSEIIEDDFIRVLIPVLEREQSAKDDLCGVYEDSKWKRLLALFSKKGRKKRLSRLERIKKRDAYNLNCLGKYYSFSIDSIPYKEQKFSFFRDEKQEFALTYIQLKDIQKGQHTLKIERAYKNKDGENAVQFINFQKK